MSVDGGVANVEGGVAVVAGDEDVYDIVGGGVSPVVGVVSFVDTGLTGLSFVRSITAWVLFGGEFAPGELLPFSLYLFVFWGVDDVSEVTFLTNFSSVVWFEPFLLFMFVGTCLAVLMGLLDADVE